MENIEDIYELSSLQEGMLLDSLAVGAAGLYVIQLEYRLEGLFVISAFRQAWEEVIARQTVLRTSFHWRRTKKPVQVVHRAVDLPFEERDWSGLSKTESERRVQEYLERDRQRGLEFDKPPLIRLLIFRLDRDRHGFIWSFPHALIEGWSAALVLEEVLALYRSIISQKPSRLPDVVPYRRYIEWLQAQSLSEAENYWRKELRGLNKPTTLGLSPGSTKPYAPAINYAGAQVVLSEDETRSLRAFAKQAEVTVNTVVQGAWALLLARYGNCNDVLFGSMVSGRSAAIPEIETMVGLCVNILPSRVKVDPQQETVSWLRQLQRKQVQARRYEFLPLAEVRRWCDIPEQFTFFESLYVFENWQGDLTDLQWGEQTRVVDVRGYHGSPGYPLTVIVTPGRTLALAATYDSERLGTRYIESLLSHFQRLLMGIVDQRQGRLVDIPMLSGAERSRLLHEWARQPSQSPDGRPVHEILQDRAEEAPHAEAVVAGDQQLNYAELNARANQLAAYLLKLGINPGARVGLCLKRAPAAIVAMFGVLKAGAAYIPLDAEQPRSRLALVIRDAAPDLVITQQSVKERLPDDSPPLLCVDSEWGKVSREEEQNPSTIVEPEDLAYIIYTSGSAGRPKGVLIPHRALSNFVEAATAAYDITARDRILQFASLSFDASVEEIFPGLARGATLVLRNDSMITRAQEFIDTCLAWRVSVLDLPTAYWHVLVDAAGDAGVQFPPSVRAVIIGGEAADTRRLEKWRNSAGPTPVLINSYGPTEATVVATTGVVEPKLESQGPSLTAPIGRPLRNVQTYVLDQWMRPVPTGVVGELYIGGAGLAHGYANEASLTAERFLPHPFVDEPGARLFRTGDVVRHLPDGSLEFVARADLQVKLSGYRVELEEIEAALSLHPHVRQAAMVVLGQAHDRRLISYVVAEPGAAPMADELQAFLRGRLPDYMVPSGFVFLAALPLTPNGKIDRRSLPEPSEDSTRRGKEFLDPQTQIESTIAEVWKEVVGVDRVSATDKFFDLGGNSLMLMLVIVKLEKELGVRMDPGELVFSTLAQLAALCRERIEDAQTTSPST